MLGLKSNECKSVSHGVHQHKMKHIWACQLLLHGKFEAGPVFLASRSAYRRAQATGAWSEHYDCIASWDRKVRLELDFFKICMHERRLAMLLPALVLVTRLPHSSAYKLWPLAVRRAPRRGRGGRGARGGRAPPARGGAGRGRGGGRGRGPHAAEGGAAADGGPVAGDGPDAEDGPAADWPDDVPLPVEDGYEDLLDPERDEGCAESVASDGGVEGPVDDPVEKLLDTWAGG